VAAQYTALAQKAAEKHTSFTDFVEALLMAERESRRARPGVVRNFVFLEPWVDERSSRDSDCITNS
jgi:hypothetical protein